MNPVMMLCYMFVLCRKEPLNAAISREPNNEVPGWVGLFGGMTVSTEETNKFLFEYLSNLSGYEVRK